MSDGGKGSAPRQFSVDRDTFANNWDRIFKKSQCDWILDFETNTGAWYNCTKCSASEFVSNKHSVKELECRG